MWYAVCSARGAMKRCRTTFLGHLPVTALFAVASASAVACGQSNRTASQGSHVGGSSVEDAARANLQRVSAEIDANHLANYALTGAVADQFVSALELEYGNEPDQLQRRLQVLASMVFFSAPEVTTDPDVGRTTPFHGMDDAAFNLLMANEDVVFNSHVAFNGGSPKGVRPFSVCETTYLIGVSRGQIDDSAFATNHTISNYDAYAHAYQAFAQSCAQQDLAEWYDFRGLGGLRPTWLESNFSDRVLRNMLKKCAHSTAGDCADFAAGRHAFRDRKNTALALREMVYSVDPASTMGGMSDEAYMIDPTHAGVFVDDRDGDGVAEWIAPGALALVPGAGFTLDSGKSVTVSNDGASLAADDGSATFAVKSATVQIQSTGTFTGVLPATFTFADGSTGTAKLPTAAVQPVTRVDTRWSASMLGQSDLGLTQMFPPDGCSGDSPSPDACATLRRFYSLIDRHENFYQTYSAVDGRATTIASQPSPLVACSVTLAASHQWDGAGTPTGGRAGFIYLMRLPFAQILVGDTRSIDTLGRLSGDPLHGGPKTLALQDVYAGNAQLDMHQVWLDIATLSHDQYANEHEISKFGSVPAGQIEGILVVRRPAAMGDPPDGGSAAPPTPMPMGNATGDDGGAGEGGATGDDGGAASDDGGDDAPAE